MHFHRLGEVEIGRNIGGDDIRAVSLTHRKIRQVALKTQENQLRIACEIKSAGVIELRRQRKRTRFGAPQPPNDVRL